jgi:hypothetical protein
VTPIADTPPQGVKEVESTSYCLQGKMSDGTQTRFRSVAMNTLPLGTRIQLIGPRDKTFFGLRRFVVRDRIAAYSELDFWHASCSASMTWGRRPVRFVLGWDR